MVSCLVNRLFLEFELSAPWIFVLTINILLVAHPGGALIHTHTGRDI